MPGKAGKKGHDRGCLNQAASQCIGNDDVSSHDGVDQAGNTEKRFATQFERIAKLSSTRRKITSTCSNLQQSEINRPVAHGKIRSATSVETKVLAIYECSK